MSYVAQISVSDIEVSILVRMMLLILLVVRNVISSGCEFMWFIL